MSLRHFKIAWCLQLQTGLSEITPESKEEASGMH